MIRNFIDTIIPKIYRKSYLTGYALHSREGIRFIELKNSYVRYLVKGKGKGKPTIALAPDSPITIEMYDQVINELSKDFQVIVFEVPAFGFSIPKMNFDFHYLPWTETVAEFLKKINLGPYVLTMPCVAGLSAIGIANQHPEMIQGVISSQTACWSEQRRWVFSRSKMGILTVPVWGQILLQLLKKKRGSNVYQEIANKRIEEFTQITNQTMVNGACFCFASAAQFYIKAKTPELVRPIPQPALAIWGDADQSHNKAGIDKDSIRQILPNAEIIHFKEAGHYPEVEEPEMFCELVRKFMRENF